MSHVELAIHQLSNHEVVMLSKAGLDPASSAAMTITEAEDCVDASQQTRTAEGSILEPRRSFLTGTATVVVRWPSPRIGSSRTMP